MGIDLQASHDLLRDGPVTLWVRRDWREALPLDALLAGAPPSAWGTPVPHGLRGRAAVHVLATRRGQIVAKAASRGGIIGGLLRHWYADPERPAREARVAEQLAARGVPTPPVVVARATRGPLGLHRLELATARVTGARDLLEVLRGGSLTEDERRALAAAAGRTLRRLHDEGLRHRDLQVKNLLVPQPPDPSGLLTIIDLDRCQLGDPLDEDQRVASLARFARSLVKRGLLPAGPGEHLPGGGRAALRAFLEAYGGPARALRLRAVRRRLARSLQGHRWLWGGRV